VNSKLFRTAPNEIGQPKFPIFAESETLFFFKFVEATLEFQRNASGAATAVRLRQGPIKTLAPRNENRVGVARATTAVDHSATAVG